MCQTGVQCARAVGGSQFYCLSFLPAIGFGSRVRECFSYAGRSRAENVIVGLW